jgi:two-component system cell cycle sensor histidine kinase PleC
MTGQVRPSRAENGEAQTSALSRLSEWIANGPMALVVLVATGASILAAAAFCYAFYALLTPEFFSSPAAMILPLVAPAVTAPPMFYGLALIIRRLAEARHELREKQEELERHLAEIEAVSDQLRVARLASEEAAQAKSLFLASMSHELRTPLNAIIGFSQSMQQEIDGPIESARYRGYVGDIHTAGQHLLALVNDILDLSKIEAGKLSIEVGEVHLPDVFEDAIRLLRPGYEEHSVKLQRQIAEEVTWAFADRRALLQMLLNLLSNALRYTPDGGLVEIAAKPRGEGWQLTVSDSGIGIDPEEIARVQQPFERIEGAGISRGGTGLGLTLVKGLMELHGGGMEIDSTPGEGTTVTLSFPRRAAAAQSDAPPK